MRLRQCLPTDREREILRGEIAVSRTFSYQIRTRVRGKVDRLAEGIRILEAPHPDLVERVEHVVCDPH